MPANRNKRLSVLSEAEKHALYDLPDFDDFQRVEFFAMSEKEHAIVFQRNGVRAQLYCLFQMGYFKAKQAFFRFSLQDVPDEDISFVMQRYFPGKTIALHPLQTTEYYLQRNAISELFGYRLWLESDVSTLMDKAAELARHDVTPTFILTELIVFLNSRKIVRPGYTTLQTIIGDALTFERNRLDQLIQTVAFESQCVTDDCLQRGISGPYNFSAVQKDNQFGQDKGRRDIVPRQFSGFIHQR